nr:reverse transcriptase domain-containing protein [Tanacetum cinerariifolium]
MLEILSRRFFLKLNLSDHMSILMDLQETLKGRWRYLIPAEPQIHNHMLIPDYPDIIFQDFRYSDGFECFQALKQTNFDLKTTGDYQKVQLNELNKLWDQTYENSLIYKVKTKKIRDSRIKNQEFHVDDHVLLFNSRLKIFLGKLKSRWSGPFTTTEVFPYGTVELSQPNVPNFKVNGHQIKHYHSGDIPALDVLNLHIFPMNN